MNFVRTQNYSGSKASGGLIDFTKRSILETEETQKKDKKRNQDKQQVEFKPKELFTDRDIEYAVENLTSATAITSAFSEEDIQHLDKLEKKKDILWKKRKLEQEEYAKEAERKRKELLEKEDSSDSHNSATNNSTPPGDTYNSFTIFNVKRTDKEISSISGVCGIKVVNRKSKSSAPLIEGYSSSED
ncbi:hypothetical protein BaOVIS_031860 [Babesia ovis]|uniref:Uncharacterized protein n=1 Tax=Babesia ovis TaxID=5869 RepID=A0A9W5WWL8_BABOV|nr:hypothetical protein BaOVIS_031860 [Babesia ovis]